MHPPGVWGRQELRRLGIVPDQADRVQRAQAGDRQAYAALVRHWSGPVLAICLARVERSAAEDLAQDAFLRAFAALSQLREPARFGGWLCNIARRLCLDWLKAGARRSLPFSALGAAGTPSHFVGDDQGPPGIAERNEQVSELLQAVDALPDKLREVIVHYYYEDISYRQLGERLGVSSATINQRLTRARLLLRERLGAVP